MQASPKSLPARLVPRLLIAAGVLACVSGMVLHRLWDVVPLPRVAELLVLALLSAGLAWPLCRWMRLHMATALSGVWLLAMVAMSGLLPTLAVALLGIAAAALGGRVVGDTRPALAACVGLALIAGLGGWLLPLPVFQPWLLAPLLLAVVVCRRHGLRTQFQTARVAWQSAVAAAPRAAAWGMVALGLASIGTWLPTMQYDDLAYHLGLPWQLMEHGRYALDPTQQVWALAPWASDVLHGIAQVLARAEARGPLNAVWLLIAAAQLGVVSSALELRPAMRWAVIALYATLPPVAALLAGMQTETAAIATTLALAAVAMRHNTRGDVFAVAALYGLLCALKPLHAMAAAPLLLWACWRMRASLRASPRSAVAAALLGVLIAGSSYLQAWRVSGNPLLPLLNGHFRSPYFAPVNFDDPRWHQGFGLQLPWCLTFDTERYLEGWNGGFGLVLVALAGAWVLALADRRTRMLALVATLAIALPLMPLQYARYAVPGLVLLLPALVHALQRHASARVAATLVAAVCVLGLAYQANANWLLHTGGPKRALLAAGADRPLFERYAPERALAQGLRAAGMHGAVLDLDGAAYAEFATRGRTMAWYAPHLEKQRAAADADATGTVWAGLWQQQDVSDVLLRGDALNRARSAALARVDARRMRTIGDAQWWRLGDSAR